MGVQTAKGDVGKKIKNYGGFAGRVSHGCGWVTAVWKLYLV